jgi:hypothetical protein
MTTRASLASGQVQKVWTCIIQERLTTANPVEEFWGLRLRVLAPLAIKWLHPLVAALSRGPVNAQVFWVKLKRLPPAFSLLPRSDLFPLPSFPYLLTPVSLVPDSAPIAPLHVTCQICQQLLNTTSKTSDRPPDRRHISPPQIWRNLPQQVPGHTSRFGTPRRPAVTRILAVLSVRFLYPLLAHSTSFLIAPIKSTELEAHRWRSRKAVSSRRPRIDIASYSATHRERIIARSIKG